MAGSTCGCERPTPVQRILATHARTPVYLRQRRHDEDDEEAGEDDEEIASVATKAAFVALVFCHGLWLERVSLWKNSGNAPEGTQAAPWMLTSARSRKKLRVKQRLGDSNHDLPMTSTFAQMNVTPRPQVGMPCDLIVRQYGDRKPPKIVAPFREAIAHAISLPANLWERDL